MEEEILTCSAMPHRYEDFVLTGGEIGLDQVGAGEWEAKDFGLKGVRLALLGGGKVGQDPVRSLVVELLPLLNGQGILE